MGDSTSGSPYDGWQGWAHPNSPAGGGGPGNFVSAQPLGSEPWYLAGDVHPLSPVGLNQAAVPAGRFAATPLSLDLIMDDIGIYLKDALNADLKTTFGEISPNLHDKLPAEANAVVSTIFNRFDGIQAARKAFALAKQALPALKKAEGDTKARYEDLANNPSTNKVTLKDGYDEAKKQAHERYKEALSASTKQQTALNKVSSKKIEMQSYVDAGRREATDLTLADIIEPDSQYEGTKKGRSDYDRFSKMTGEDQKRNMQRWQTAKSAVESLAMDTSKRVKYLEFRANHDAKGQLKPLVAGRTRIGGNDFF